MRGDLEYRIEKDNSKKSIFLTIVLFLVLLVWIFITYGISIIRGVNKGAISEEGIIAGSIVWGLIAISIVIILYIRFKKWKYPFQAKWNQKGILVRHPNGKTKEFYWKDVSEIKLEGENWAKMLVPYYYVGRFSWNSLLWMLSAGVTKLVWRINFAFFHFRLKNKKIILIL
jgi:hypothetical protein